MARVGLVLLWLALTPAHADTCATRPAVSEVYPSGDRVPENLLRLYVYFTAPMSRHRALDAIHLVDDDGQIVEGVFLANKVDLWSPDSRRLTVLFDPGRVKTGLVAHNTMGRALQSGRDYTLVIDTGLRGADGCSLASIHRKTFRVVDADFDAPDLNRWEVTRPQAYSTEWLWIVLNGPHDHVSLAYRIRVVSEDGEVVPGRIALGAAEAEWRFQPNSKWGNNRHQIVIHPMLEDVAGNRLTGSFERPLSDENTGQYRTIEFVPIMDRE